MLFFSSDYRYPCNNVDADEWMNISMSFPSLLVLFFQVTTGIRVNNVDADEWMRDVEVCFKFIGPVYDDPNDSTLVLHLPGGLLFLLLGGRSCFRLLCSLGVFWSSAVYVCMTTLSQ